MQETLKDIIDFLFIEAIGVLFVLAGVFRWQYPQIFRGESWKYSCKTWVRAIKIIVGAGLIAVGIYGGIRRL
ncbi:MAG: hypothetical protein IJ435_08940 [Clostridia bacterium]|nr:hypothetical protein [Clostridia bacterium]